MLYLPALILADSHSCTLKNMHIPYTLIATKPLYANRQIAE